jgi:ketosteroid isomerase-like protein
VSANLDLVRSIYGAWERGDVSSTEWAHPEIEFVIADGPSPGTWTGLAGMKKGWRTFLGTWDGFHAEADEYRLIHDESVLVLDRFYGRGKQSGLEVGGMRTEGALLFRLRDSMVTRLVLYLDRDHAFADLGLTPEGDAASAEQRHRSGGAP